MKRDAQLQSVPAASLRNGRAGPPGLRPLPLRTGRAGRDSYLYVPPACDPEHPCPLVLLLHGAGGHAHHGLDLLRRQADAYGLILAAPASTGATWDVISERAFGADVALIDRALELVFAEYAVDERRLAVAGFSDGASYALSLGLANGRLFSHVIAFSPGFVATVETHGHPRVFISHGVDDDILPIAHCSRQIAARLRATGYDVEYQEFDGPHIIPEAISAAAVEWFLQTPPAGGKPDGG